MVLAFLVPRAAWPINGPLITASVFVFQDDAVELADALMVAALVCLGHSFDQFDFNLLVNCFVFNLLDLCQYILKLSCLNHIILNLQSECVKLVYQLVELLFK